MLKLLEKHSHMPSTIGSTKFNQRSYVKVVFVTLIMLAIAIGMGIYIYGSQYYYPNNYLPAEGHMVGSEFATGGRTTEGNQYIQFLTNTGETITYKYQTLIPMGLGPTIPLHYNVNNPEQVRIKPGTINLSAQIGMVVIIEAFILVLATGFYKKLNRPIIVKR